MNSAALLDRYRHIINISPELESDLNRCLVLHHFRKKHILLRKGEIANYMYFIQEGMLMSYHEIDGKQIMNWFLMENDVAIALIPFHRRTPSEEYIEVLQDCTLFAMHHDDLVSLYRRHLELAFIALGQTLNYYCQSEERNISFRHKNANERYQWLISTYPEFIKRVPNEYIASYLGISKFTLSRVKGQDR